MTTQSTLNHYTRQSDQPIRQTMRGLAVLLAVFAASCGGAPTQPSPAPVPTPDTSATLCSLVGTLPCQIPPPTPTPKPTAPTSATVRGTVTDATSRGVLPGVSVTLTSGNHTVTTDARGQYVVLDVPLGPLTVTVAAPSYLTQTVVVTLTGDAAVDVVLPRVAAAPSPAPSPTPAPAPTPAHGGVAWDTITMPHEFVAGTPLQTTTANQLYRDWPFPMLTTSYDFALAHFPLDLLPSGGASNIISASEMILVGVHFSQPSTAVTTLTWHRAVLGMDQSFASFSSGVLPHSTMFSYVGHFSWEVTVPGLYYMVIDTEWGSARINFVVQ